MGKSEQMRSLGSPRHIRIILKCIGKELGGRMCAVYLSLERIGM
jgi:hypothetical protein